MSLILLYNWNDVESVLDGVDRDPSLESGLREIRIGIFVFELNDG